MASETPYEIQISWNEEAGLFVAEVPALPGCRADGETHEEAREAAEALIAEWLDRADEAGYPVS